MSLNKNLKIPIRDQWAHKLAIRGTKEEWNKLARHHNIGQIDSGPPLMRDGGDTLPPAPTPPKTKPIVRDPGDMQTYNVGIVGAGAAGLFTALVFDYINAELLKMSPPPPFTFTYDIIEAATKDRVGGRLFTYNFSNPPVAHDYYDVGAMRFPDHAVMTRTFDLFTTLGMEITDLATNPGAVVGSIIPYYMNNGGQSSPGPEPWNYNNNPIWGNSYAQVQIKAGSNDPFKLSTDNSYDIPANLLLYTPDAIMSAAIEPFRQLLISDTTTDPPGTAGWDQLMEYDQLSTRQFLSMNPPVPLPTPPKNKIPPPPYNYDTIEWLETFNGGTNWYDQAFSETVLESLDFEFKDDVNWYCILGGVGQLAENMIAKAANKPTYDSRVTAISTTAPMNVEVVVNGQTSEPQTYHGVFATPPLGCLRRIDLSGAGFNYATKQAIRSLGYGPSSKIAIKFSRPWWIYELGADNITMGGLGHSDLNLRTCVYPSYNIYDPDTSTAVLLCSYTWQQDALRLGALMSTNPDHAQKVIDEAELKELMLRDLATLHQHGDKTADDMYELISGLYVDHHAYSWYMDPNAEGAFAFFAPQQFTNMWNKMIQPSSDVILVGEASSPHHAWVVGALESAVHGIHAWLGLNVAQVPEFQTVITMLEASQQGNPFVGLPPYMEPNMARWHATIGMLNREEHFRKIGHEESVAGVFAKLDLDYLKSVTE